MVDKLSIFSKGTITGTVTISSAGGNTLDDVISRLDNAVNELRLTRAGHEEWTWGDVVEDSEIQLEELDLRMEEDHG